MFEDTTPYCSIEKSNNHETILSIWSITNIITNTLDEIEKLKSK